MSTALSRKSARDLVDFDPSENQVLAPAPQRQNAAPRPGAKPAHIAAPSAPREGLGTYFILITSLLAIAYGYSTRNADVFVPYEGAGYWIGVAGGTGMLLQLAYSSVKRLKFFRRLAASRMLFQMHMVLGLTAPILILYHANFSWGATNSNVALATMLAVVASGLIGRIVYRHIHFGLHGAKANANQMFEHARHLLGDIEDDVGGSQGQIAARLANFAALPIFHERSLSRQFVSALVIPFKVRLARLKFNAMIRQTVSDNAVKNGWSNAELAQHRKQAQLHVREFLQSFSAASQLAFWERLFSVWHLLHVPLFYLLLVSGVIHVVAVHWY
jgi:hypothetical protein